jgi:putative ABC transport system permease protein
VSAGLPFAGASESSFFPMGEPRGVDSVKMAVAYFVDVNYIETMKIPLLAGRTFGPQDRPDAPAGLIIDEHLADKFFPGQDPVGQRLQDGMSEQPSVEVVGVVGHVRHYGPDAPRTALYQMYYAYPQLPEDAQRQVAANMTVVVRTRGEPHALTAQVRATVRAIDPEQPIFAVSTLEEHIARTLAQRRFTISLLGAFAGLALVLAAVGLYAVMAHAVVQRTHELGVRLSLGAQPRAVVALVVRQGMRLVGAGVLLGLVGAFALSRMMESLLSDDIGATDPASYLGVTAMLALVGLTATWIPARRATRIDPMVAMRHE